MCVLLSNRRTNVKRKLTRNMKRLLARRAVAPHTFIEMISESGDYPRDGTNVQYANAAVAADRTSTGTRKRRSICPNTPKLIRIIVN